MREMQTLVVEVMSLSPVRRGDRRRSRVGCCLDRILGHSPCAYSVTSQQLSTKIEEIERVDEIATEDDEGSKQEARPPRDRNYQKGLSSQNIATWAAGARSNQMRALVNALPPLTRRQIAPALSAFPSAVDVGLQHEKAGTSFTFSIRALGGKIKDNVCVLNIDVSSSFR